METLAEPEAEISDVPRGSACQLIRMPRGMEEGRYGYQLLYHHGNTATARQSIVFSRVAAVEAVVTWLQSNPETSSPATRLVIRDVVPDPAIKMHDEGVFCLKVETGARAKDPDAHFVLTSPSPRLEIRVAGGPIETYLRAEMLSVESAFFLAKVADEHLHLGTRLTEGDSPVPAT